MKYLIKNRLEQFKGTVVSTEISNEENLKFSLEDGLNKIYKLLLNLKNKKDLAVEFVEEISNIYN